MREPTSSAHAPAKKTTTRKLLSHFSFTICCKSVPLDFCAVCGKLNARGRSIESKSLERERLESAADGKNCSTTQRKKGFVS
jgi:hypothetical protein